MTIRRIAWMATRSLRRHAVGSAVTAAAVALASGLFLSVAAIQQQVERAFVGGPMTYDAVLGARGSQLQLVLNTVFHLETSPGNLPWQLYRAIAADPRVEAAIPYAVGDNLRGFRIVGTTLEAFERPDLAAERRMRLAEGRFFDPGRREAVIGSFVAERTGLEVGSTFSPHHGVLYDERARHDEEYLVVGILAATNTPGDRVIWIPIEGVFRMEGHVLRGSGEEFRAEPGREIPDEHKEVSAVMIRLTSPHAGFGLDQEINRQGRIATLAWPISRVMAELFDKMGWAHLVLKFVSYLVLFVASAGILAGLYNTIRERRREFAILRAVGASRGAIFGIVTCESAAIAALGTVGGFFVYAAIMTFAAHLIRIRTGVVLDLFAWHDVFVTGPILTIALGIVAGLLPAWRAFRTDVASHLVPHS